MIEAHHQSNTVLIMNLWRIVFHEVRHFIQFRKFNSQSKPILGCKDFHFTGAKKMLFLDIDNAITESALQNLDLHKLPKKNYSNYIKRKEYDAEIISFFAGIDLLMSYDGQTFDLDSVVKILLMSADEIREQTDFFKNRKRQGEKASLPDFKIDFQYGDPDKFYTIEVK